MTVYQSILLLGAPGSGKGTQGKILGKIPGFYHCACGDVFRALDPNSEFGKLFIQYSSKGQLVPDDVIVRLVLPAVQEAVTTSHGPRALNQPHGRQHR